MMLDILTDGTSRSTPSGDFKMWEMVLTIAYVSVAAGDFYFPMVSLLSSLLHVLDTVREHDATDNCMSHIIGNVSVSAKLLFMIARLEQRLSQESEHGSIYDFIGEISYKNIVALFNDMIVNGIAFDVEIMTVLTWLLSKWELREYMIELIVSNLCDPFRANLRTDISPRIM